MTSGDQYGLTEGEIPHSVYPAESILLTVILDM